MSISATYLKKSADPNPPQVGKSPFTGRREDSLGRTQCYSEGEHVACGDEEQKESTEKRSEAASVTKTEAFKNWFGDWETDPQNASKVVDKDGKPQAVYHGSSEVFQSFDTSVGADLGGFGHSGAFFSASPEVASSYAYHQSLEEKQTIRKLEIIRSERESLVANFAEQSDTIAPDSSSGRTRWLGDLLDEEKITRDQYDLYWDLDNQISDLKNKTEPDTTPNVSKVYLNLRNPKIVNANKMSWQYVVPEHMASVDRSKYDGIIFRNVRDSGDESEHITDTFVAFDPTQIKSVNNIGTFDPDNANFNKGISATYRTTTLPDQYTKSLGNHKYGCLLAVLPEPLRKQINDWADATIPAEHLTEEGREYRSHVTILYGFKDASEETLQELRAFLTRFGPISMKLEGLSLFTGGKDGDVLKLDVDSPDLHELNAALREMFDVHIKYKDYSPHVTVAFLRPEVAEQYVGMKTPFEGTELRLTVAEFSDPDKNVEEIPLTHLPTTSSSFSTAFLQLADGGKALMEYESKGAADVPTPSPSPTAPQVAASPFSGRKEDALGRTQCYQQGQHVPCNDTETPNQNSQQTEEQPVEEELTPEQDYKQNGTKSKAFKQWFGDWENDPAGASKVVKEDGTPSENYEVKKAYHGRGSVDFDAFSKDEIGKNGSQVGKGFYFAEDKRIAENYSNSQSGQILEAYLCIKNPFDFDMRVSQMELRQWADHAYQVAPTKFKRDIFESEIESSTKAANDPDKTISGYAAWNAMANSVGMGKVNNVIAAAGYDGISHISRDAFGTVKNEKEKGLYGRVWIAFEPTQIKSVDNAGTFDPDNPNFTKALSAYNETAGGALVPPPRFARKTRHVQPPGTAWNRESGWIDANKSKELRKKYKRVQTGAIPVETKDISAGRGSMLSQRTRELLHEANPGPNYHKPPKEGRLARSRLHRAKNPIESPKVGASPLRGPNRDKPPAMGRLAQQGENYHKPPKMGKLAKPKKPSSSNNVPTATAFTGELTDSAGRRQCYQQGSHVPCADTGKEAPKPPQNAPEASQKPSKPEKQPQTQLEAEKPVESQPEAPKTEKENEPKEPTGTGDTPASGQADKQTPADSGPVENTAERSSNATGDRSGESAAKPPDKGTAEYVPASIEKVNQRLDRFSNFFRAKGQHQIGDWLDKLRSHVNEVGTDEALEALGEKVEGEGEEVQYGGWSDIGDFVESYLDRNGITLVYNGDLDADKKIVSTVAPSNDEGGVPSRGEERDVFPSLQTLKNKLEEAQHLPGLEKSEDLGKLMGGKLGDPVPQFTPDVLDKLNSTYGEGKWIVKPYGDEAYSSYGIFFPQRVQQIKQDAQNAIWFAGENLARYGFKLRRNRKNEVVGIKHEGGDRYDFGTEKYNNTINGDARTWADRAAAAAPNETGATLPEGSFMAQPAFKAVGVSDADRAAGVAIAPGEGRVHIVTKNGKASIVPHATWIKGQHLPVVFEDDDTRAMAQAALDAINNLPESERQGQLYAPDILKTEDGYRSVEANPANEAGASGYLQDNPFIIDAYVSHVTGREPAHVRFIRKLLSAKKKPKKRKRKTEKTKSFLNVYTKGLDAPKVPSSPFTGRKEDALGRTQCYSEGEHVACNTTTEPLKRDRSSQREPPSFEGFEDSDFTYKQPKPPEVKKPAKKSTRKELEKRIKQSYAKDLEMAKTNGLPKEKADSYKNALDRVVNAMPVTALEKLEKGIGWLQFQSDAAGVTREYQSATKGASLFPGQQIHGFYQPTTGRVVLDGEGEWSDFAPGTDATEKDQGKNIYGTYAHELTHAIDRGHTYSGSKEWYDAWKSEILQKGFPLSNYATTSAIEGFAEFGRLVYGSDADMGKAEKLFPKCFAYWKSIGLYESKNGSKSLPSDTETDKPILNEVFNYGGVDEETGILYDGYTPPEDSEKSLLIQTKGWVTLENGTHVFIDDKTGSISAGPDALVGKKPSELSKKPKVEQVKPSPFKKPAAKQEEKPQSKKLPEYVNQPIDLSNEEYPKLIAELGKKVCSQLTPEEAVAIEDYTMSDYATLNLAMRECPPDFKCVSGDDRKRMEAIESAIAKAPLFPEPVMVYRGIAPDAFTGHALLEEAQKSIDAGSDWMMPSLSSTTTKSETAFGFGMGSENKILFHIKAKTGLPVATVSSSPVEQEIIQSAKTKYKVVAVKKTPLTKNGTSNGTEANVIYLEEV